MKTNAQQLKRSWRVAIRSLDYKATLVPARQPRYRFLEKQQKKKDTRCAALRRRHAQPSNSQKVASSPRRYRSLSAVGRKRRRLTIGFSCWMRVRLPAPGIFTGSSLALMLRTKSYSLATADNIKPLKLAPHSSNSKSTD